jgi:hypothetical protein
MKLFTELTEDVKFIVEEKEGKKQYFIEGYFLQAVDPNRNRRSYPLDIMEQAVATYQKEYIDMNRAFGELGHPEGPTVNLDRASHMIKSLTQEGNYWKGKAKILDETPMGKIVKALLDEGANLGVSSRGMGSLVEQNGIKIVQKDFILSTAADIVSDPSSQKAWVQGIMEGKEWAYNASTGTWMVAEAIKEEIKRLPAKVVAENQAAYFERLLKSVK